MASHKIATVFISSSDEFNFLRVGINQACIFSEVVSVAIGCRRWNGEPEDVEGIKTFIASYINNPKVKFVLYDPIDGIAKSEYVKYMTKKEMMPEALARHEAMKWVPLEGIDYVLFMDSDEVVDGRAFLKWLDTGRYQSMDVMKFACYWYWRDVRYRAKDYLEDSIVMVKRHLCLPEILFHDFARTFFFSGIDGLKERMIMSEDKRAMIHHFSWVRTKKQMLKKVTSWGHQNDFGNLVEKVHEEYSRPFNGKDFLKGLSYDVLSQPPFDL